MGTNKRYANSIDRRVGERADEAATRGVQPTSLTDVELELDTYPLTKTPRPPAVRAWVWASAVETTPAPGKPT